MNKHYLSREDIIEIDGQLNQKNMLEKLSKEFVYNEALSLQENISIFGKITCKEAQLKEQARMALSQFLAIDSNIPIEINFRTLKSQNIKKLLNEWLNGYLEPSVTAIQRVYTSNLQGLLLKRVLFEEKETIDDYFNTLSDKNMLKPFNLYQLLVEILSNYFLYDSNTDAETFFEKVNSFDIFVTVVETFFHSEKRINGSGFDDYIKRYEFEKLLEFWEHSNPELILLSERRKNLIQVDTQTTRINIENKECQTDRQTSSLESAINSILFQINRLTVELSDKRQLESLQRMYECLRKEKIALQDPHSNTNNSILEIDYEGEEELITQKTEKTSPRLTATFMKLTEAEQPRNLMSKSPRQRIKSDTFLQDHQKHQNQYLLKLSPERKRKQVLETIYGHYGDTVSMDIERLQQFFEDLGVVNEGENHLIFNLLKDSLIDKPNAICFEQFYLIMKAIMGEDRDLTLAVLQEFADLECSKVKMHVISPPKQASLLGHTTIQTSRTHNNQVRKDPHYHSHYQRNHRYY